jgi:hypothetical protein
VIRVAQALAACLLVTSGLATHAAEPMPEAQPPPSEAPPPHDSPQEAPATTPPETGPAEAPEVPTATSEAAEKLHQQATKA